MAKKQASIVAFYGAKPASFRRLIETLQAELAARIGPSFVARDVSEVHATLIGLEGIRAGNLVYNSNFAFARNVRRPMDLAGLLEDLRQDASLPLNVQFAGYDATRATPIVSQGKTPYLRSFGFQGDLAVMIGWPVDAESRPLHELRKHCQRRDILHKYHLRDTDIDDDCFVVIGSLRRDSRPTDRQLEDATVALRDFMACLAPVQIQIDVNALSLVQYEDPRLPLQTTVSWSLDEASRNQATVLGCYPDGSS